MGSSSRSFKRLSCYCARSDRMKNISGMLSGEPPRKYATRLKHYQAQDPFNDRVAALIEIRTRLAALGEYDRSINPSSGVTDAMGLASEAIDEYIGCVRMNTEFESICGDEHPEVLPLLNGVIFAYGKSIQEFVDQYE